MSEISVKLKPFCGESELQSRKDVLVISQGNFEQVRFFVQLDMKYASDWEFETILERWDSEVSIFRQGLDERDLRDDLKRELLVAFDERRFLYRQLIINRVRNDIETIEPLD